MKRARVLREGRGVLRCSKVVLAERAIGSALVGYESAEAVVSIATGDDGGGEGGSKSQEESWGIHVRVER